MEDRIDGPGARPPGLFQSFFIGGFECSSHRRCDGKRLDLLAATGHDVFAAADYRALRGHGIGTVRDGIRWHLAEPEPGRYDWSSVLPMLQAARQTGTQVIWDLCHYGWPDDIDIWSAAFVERFAAFAGAAAALVRDESDGVPFYCPINEISFWAWKGGDVGGFNPCTKGRGDELKRQLVRATLAATDAIRDADPRARIVHIDPVINVVADPKKPQDRRRAEGFRDIQFAAWDMIAGFREPELGGAPDYLDVIGVNYYSDNQWYFDGRMIELGEVAYRPFREILLETYSRYGRPIFIAETGAEGDDMQAYWLRYVGAEARAAMAMGVPLEGLSLYPVVHYPGWDDERMCECGLLRPIQGPDGAREVAEPVARSFAMQRRLTAAFLRAARGDAGSAAL